MNNTTDIVLFVLALFPALSLAIFNLIKLALNFRGQFTHKRMSRATIALRAILVCLLVIYAYFLIDLLLKDSLPGPVIILLGYLVFIIENIFQHYKNLALRLYMRWLMWRTNVSDDTRNNVALLLHDEALEFTISKKGRENRDIAENWLLLARYRESYGNYELALLYYGWARAVFLKYALKRDRQIKSLKMLRKYVRAQCGRIRVLQYLTPEKAEEEIQILSELATAAQDHEIATQLLLVGGKLPASNFLQSLGARDPIEIMLLRQKAKPIYQGFFVDWESGVAALRLANYYEKKGNDKELKPLLKLIIDGIRQDILDLRYYVRLDAVLMYTNYLERDKQYNQAFDLLINVIDDLKNRAKIIVKSGSEKELLTLSEHTSRVSNRLLGLAAQHFCESPEQILEACKAGLSVATLASEIRINISGLIFSSMERTHANEVAEARRLRQKIADAWISESQFKSEMLTRVYQIDLERIESFLIRTQIEKIEFDQILSFDFYEFVTQIPKDAIYLKIICANCSNNRELYIAYVFSHGNIRAEILTIGEREVVDTQINSLLRLYKFAANPPGTNGALSYLNKVLIEPLLTQFKNRQHVLVDAAGIFNSLPFEALKNKDNVFLADLVDFTYIDSIKAVLRKQTSYSASDNKAIVIASPDFDWSGEKLKSSQKNDDIGNHSTHFEHLYWSEKEGETLAEMLDAELITGKAATVPKVKAIQNPVILHIATHAFALQHKDLEHELDGVAQSFIECLENPETRAGLAFSGINSVQAHNTVNDVIEDGILSAFEVSALDLENTHLVVLSACDTGQGEMHAGEGVLGLRRAFAVAGAKAIVTSVWPVPDEHTYYIMHLFYLGITSGLSFSSALNQAKAKIRQEYNNPWYWAGFVIHDYGGAKNTISFKTKKKRIKNERRSI